jgi:hypothetical protein
LGVTAGNATMLDITKVGGGEFYVANGISTNSK